MQRALPSGTVTFLFTDVEGSTKLLQELGSEGYARALAEHRRIVRGAFTRHGGVEVDTQGDAFFVAFPTAPGALAAVEEMRHALASGPIRVRMGLHTGTPLLAEEGYVGPDVNRAARIAAAGHGGQVLVSASTASLLGGGRPRDLGEHRLKDLSAPERIYQLGEGEFPPLKSLHQTNLPVPTTPFLGRERELGELSELLGRDDVRLLTLTGPGGTGKTRLALQAAGAAADEFPAGVWWVPLAPLREPSLVLATAAHAVGANDDLAEHIADKRLLLLFDNFEHVVDAAVDVATLLGACPNLRLLVTSRELLAVPGEQAYPVPPLEPAEGTELFVARARAAKPDFRPNGTVAPLCERLDHLPLAIELAAARVRLLSPEQLLERLSQRLDLLKAGRGVDPRQQTLRATIEWSHELLTPEEQQLFARLSVFRGGCTLEGAEQVCEAELDNLQSLVDKSLVRAHEGDRFRMLETIREYATERLAASGEEEAVRRRHAEYLGMLFSDALRRFYTREQATYLEESDAEHDNVRAALQWAIAAGDVELELRLAVGAWQYWFVRGFHVEGRHWLEGALARSAGWRTHERAEVLGAAGVIAYRQGDFERAREVFEQGLALCEELGDKPGVARMAGELGNVAVAEGAFARALATYEEARRLCEELGDKPKLARIVMNMGSVANMQGDFDRGRKLLHEALALQRELEDWQSAGISLHNLGRVDLRFERLEEARALFSEALDVAERIGYREMIAYCLEAFAEIGAAEGEPEWAARLLGAAEALIAAVGARLEGEEQESYEATVEALRDELGPDRFDEERSAGSSLPLEAAVSGARRRG